MFNMMMDNKRKEKGEFASSAGLAYDRSNWIFCHLSQIFSGFDC
jgi:hypothetical protein